MAGESLKETEEHVEQVSAFILQLVKELLRRKDVHDASKKVSPELEAFDRTTPLLKKLQYGSDEYKQALQSMKPALDHHYVNNRHHPEHFKTGIREMNLVDVVEMLCDWKAATLRTKNKGDIVQSIAFNKKRFGYSDDLEQILLNTVKDFGWDE